jgi:NAD(P)-dependent dehydrogenase (short-subunit alcohol dehydrogenase family)
MEDLEGRTAVVTGAASGIGLAITEAFVAEGMRVAMVDVEAEALSAHASRLTSDGADVRSLVADVSDADAIEGVADEVVRVFGGLHVAVNNAGIQQFDGIWDLSLQDWRRIIDVDLWGVIHGVRSFVPRMIAGGDEGHVVNVGSIASLLPFQNIAPYTVAKHGVLGLTDVLREEIAATTSRIGVSVLLPGLVQTGISPVGVVSAATAAANVVDGIRRDRPYIYTDDFGKSEIETRLNRILAAREQTIPEQEGIS